MAPKEAMQSLVDVGAAKVVSPGSADCSDAGNTIAPNECPACHGGNVSGLVGAFWAPVDESGDMEGQWLDYQGSTELTGDRHCTDCNHEWEE